MKSYFYPKSIFTAITAFADIFNDMSVRVYDNKTDDIVGVKPVPVMLAPKEKIAQILTVSPTNDVDPQADNYLPRISINNTGLSWHPDRMRGKNEKRLINIEYEEDGSSKKIQTDTQPVPYNLTFEVTIWTKYLTDGWQIIENIVPFFAPEIHVSYKERNFAIEHKAKVTLDSIGQNHVFEFGESDRRILQWNLQFTMEATMWKPMEVKKEILCSIIKIANVPCKKIPFQGEKIIAYEPIKYGYETLADSTTNVSLEHLDPSEEYSLMVNYWKKANNVMQPDFASCTLNACQTTPGPKPEWDSSYDTGDCKVVIKKPCIIVEENINQITNYWQEQIVDENNIIQIVSFKRVYTSTGEDVTGPDIISNDDYPDCWNENIVSSSSSSSSSYQYSSSSSSSSFIEVCDHITTG